MPRRTVEESKKLDNLILAVEQRAAAQGMALTDPASYARLAFDILQEAGEIPRGATYKSNYSRDIKAVEDKARRILKSKKAEQRQQNMPRYTTRTFNVTIDGNRTSISLSKCLCTLLCLKLGVTPDSTESNKAVVAWLKGRFDTYAHQSINTSQWATEQVVLFLIGKKLKGEYLKWSGDNE